MRAEIDIIIGIGFLLSGLFVILGTTKIIEKIFEPNKGFFWYKYLRKGESFENFLKERFSKKTKRIIEIVIGVIIGVAMIILGLNVLIKGIIDPDGKYFWILF